MVIELGPYRSGVLIEARPAAEEQAWLTIDPPSGFTAAHRHAGQFCSIRVGDVEGVFAMGSAPGAAPLRFLVRIGSPEGGEAADRLAEMADAAPIEMTLPAGPGFALDSARGGDVVLVATGTGVAPVSAVMEVLLRDRSAYGTLTLVHGLKSPGHVAIGEDLDRWKAAGVRVHVCYSHIDADGALVGDTVQDALARAAPDLGASAVIAVGQPAMLDSLREVVRGLGGERFLTNL